jgi:hypothetical protein
LRNLDFTQIVKTVYSNFSLLWVRQHTCALKCLFLFLKPCIIMLENDPLCRTKIVEVVKWTL